MTYQEILDSVRRGPLGDHASPRDTDAVPVEGEEALTLSDTAAYGQTALRAAQDPVTDAERFDPNLLFPEE